MKRLLRQIIGVALTVVMAVFAAADLAAATPSTKGIKAAAGHQYLRRNHSEISRNGMLRHSVGRSRAKSLKAVAAQTSDIDIPVLYGNVIDSWELESTGLYRLPASADGAFEPVALDIPGEEPGVEVNGIYYSTCYDYSEDATSVIGYDVYTGEEVYSADGTYDNVPISMCYDATDGKIYGIFHKTDEDGGGIQFGTIDYSGSVPVTTHIADLDEDEQYCGMAVSSQGKLYALLAVLDNTWQVCDTRLVTVSKTNGEMADVGMVGYYTQYQTDACIDPVSDRMFFTTCNWDGSALIEIDLATGRGSELFTFPGEEQIVGLFCPAAQVAGGAPGAATGLALDFPMGALSGTVSFTCPSTLNDGTPASGPVECRILLDNKVAETFQTAYGDAVRRTLAVDEAGIHDVAVVLVNSEGEGPVTRIRTFFGEDVPALPSEVTASYADGRMTIAWETVSAGLNGGYIDASAVRYTLVRTLPDEATVAESTTQTVCTVDMPEPEASTQFSYTLSVYYGDVLVGSVVSNTVVLGSLMPPYMQDFSGENPLEDFTILNENDDNSTWKLFGDCMRIDYTSLPMDDWLILPGLKLTAGRTYKVAFRAWAQSLGTPERIEVRYGAAPEASAMAGTVVAPVTIAVLSEDAGILSGTLTPETTGMYYIGFHAISDADTYYLYLDDVAVTPEAETAAPKSPSDFTAVADPLGHLSVKISMKAPAEDNAGQPLAALKSVVVTCDKAVVHTFEAPAPGEKLSFVHTPAAPGTYTYAAVAVTDGAESEPAEATVFCGTSLPSDVTGVRISENGHTGEVTLEWDAVTTDVTGREIDPELVRYNIYTVKGTELTALRQNVAGTQLTHQAVEGDGQDFVRFAVYGVTAAGMGNGMNSDMIPVGKPYTSFSETFADRNMNHIFGVNAINDGSMGLYEDNYLDNLNSCTGDNGFLVIYGQIPGQGVELSSGKISFDGLVEPRLTMWVYKFDDSDENTLKIEVRKPGTTFTTALDLIAGKQAAAGWNQVVVPLSGFESDAVQFRLTGIIKNYGSIALDDIEVSSASSSVASVVGQQTPEICGGVGTIDIAGADGLPVSVFAVDGRAIFSGTAASQLSVRVAPGVYMVTAGSTTAKVYVR